MATAGVSSDLTPAATNSREEAVGGVVISSRRVSYGWREREAG